MVSMTFFDLKGSGVRYLLVSVVGWLVDILMYTFTYAVVGVAIAQLFARFSGALTGFFGHKLFTFSHKSSITQTQILQYGLLWVINYGVTVWGIYFLIDVWNFHEVASKFAVELVVIPTNYLIMKYKIFNHGVVLQ